MKVARHILISVALFVLVLALIFVWHDTSIVIENHPRILEVCVDELKLIFKADFSKPLMILREDDLFEGGERVRQPVGAEWVIEGPGSAWTENNILFVTNTPRDDKSKKPGHVVMWNTRIFPENFLLEIGFSPKDSDHGLGIIFFCSMGNDEKSIFDLKKARRDGIFHRYHSGDLNSYHVSYWAMPRGTVNIRKNFGFHLVASGKDHIGGYGPGPHTIKLLRIDGSIKLEIRGKFVVSWEDDDDILGKGYIGLRTMAHTEKVGYTSFKVYEIDPNNNAN